MLLIIVRLLIHAAQQHIQLLNQIPFFFLLELTICHSHDIATIIDREGVAVRAGHHCAQPLLDAFKIVSTTRASVGAYTTYEDFDQLADSIFKVKKIFGDL